MIRFNWKIEELKGFYTLPLMELVSKSHHMHVQYHHPAKVQMCSLISIKTGGCPEDCKYCSQSAHNKTAISPTPLMSLNEVLNLSKKAINQGATRICLGAAWREVRDGKQFDEVLKIITEVAELGVEVCCTLGMLQEEQAKRLKKAGLFAYSHNLDTSEKYYPTIVTTRTYQERLKTLDIVQKTKLSVCCGGIMGMGETEEDRLELLLTLCQLNPHPESVPINRLSRIPGTPFEHRPSFSIWDMVRIIAVARIVLPKAMLRLSAGRIEMSYQDQALCFFAGANSIHMGEKLLTVGNASVDSDQEMFKLLGLKRNDP